MNHPFNEIAETLIYKVARNAGFSNDLSLFNGKMGIAILLYHSSKFFSSVEIEKLAESLLSDIIEDEYKLYKMAQEKSCEVFWGLCYLSDFNFIEIDEDFFEDIDDILFGALEDISRIGVSNYNFLGNYILLRYKTSNYSDYWMVKAKLYLDGMIKLVYANPQIYRFNISLFDSFWYMLLHCKDKGLYIDFNKDSVEEVSLFFNDITKIMPPVGIQSPGYQFYSIYNGFKYEFNILNINTLSEINALYIDKLLFPDFIMPPDNQIEKVFTNVVSDKHLLKNLNDLVNYQSIGITGYISGLAWSLINYLQHSKTALISPCEY